MTDALFRVGSAGRNLADGATLRVWRSRGISHTGLLE